MPAAYSARSCEGYSRPSAELSGMNIFKALAVAFIALLTLTVAPAETRTHPVGLEVTFPDAWDAEFSEDDLFLNESDESAVVWVTVADAGDVEAAVEETMEELGEWLTGVEVTRDDETGKINGIPARFIEGTGKMEKEPARWLVAFLEYKGKIVIVAGWGENPEWDEDKGDIVDIIRSIKG